MRKLSAVVCLLSDHDHGTLPAIAYIKQMQMPARRIDAALRERYSRCEPRGLCFPTTNSSSVPPAQPCSIVHGAPVQPANAEKIFRTNF